VSQSLVLFLTSTSTSATIVLSDGSVLVCEGKTGQQGLSFSLALLARSVKALFSQQADRALAIEQPLFIKYFRRVSGEGGGQSGGIVVN